MKQKVAFIPIRQTIALPPHHVFQLSSDQLQHWFSVHSLHQSFQGLPER